MNVLLKAFRVIYEWRYRCATQIVRTTHQVKRKRTKIKNKIIHWKRNQKFRNRQICFECVCATAADETEPKCKRRGPASVASHVQRRFYIYLLLRSCTFLCGGRFGLFFFSVCLEIFWRSFYLLISHPLHIFILLYLMASHKYRRRRQADMTAISWEMHRTSLRENWSNYFECCWRSQRWRLSVLYKTRIHWDYWFIDAYKPVAGISQVYDTRFSMIYRKSTKRLN